MKLSMPMPSELSIIAAEFTPKPESLASNAVAKALAWLSGRRPSPKFDERAGWQRRSAIKDRRVSGLDQRLKKGFWFEYHRETEAGKFDTIELTPKNRNAMWIALVREAQRYEFTDRASGGRLDQPTIVDAALDVVWTEMKGTPREERRAVIMVEAVARYMFSKYNVRGIDRRQPI
jgi:hypothetical protein